MAFWFPQGVSQALFDDVYVIFPIHVNFPVRVGVLIHSLKKLSFIEKKQWIILRYLRFLF